MKDPFVYMSFLNVASGLFSAAAGLRKALQDKAPFSGVFRLDTSNPWLFVVGGLCTSLIGVGNWYHLSIATWATVVFICTSIYDGWFDEGRKNFRFYTLTAYTLVQTALVIWSAQFSSPFSFP